jgi:putative restriction endonuclease
MDRDLDQLIRRAAFTHLRHLTESFGNVVPYRILAGGFPFKSRIVHLVAQQGIFIPAGMDVPLSIRTTAERTDGSRPYEDEVGPDGLLRYRYRGDDLMHRENLGLRKACVESIPLIWLSGVAKGMYEPEAAQAGINAMGLGGAVPIPGEMTAAALQRTMAFEHRGTASA